MRHGGYRRMCQFIVGDQICEAWPAPHCLASCTRRHTHQGYDGIDPGCHLVSIGA